ncbi:MAG TPA: iron-containing alcohol dehydrogenase [Anaerolineae bacterium]|nr:iron-containing alcohol dehydrogenase [Anaerolineae bacterium]HQK14414.1 iron-containing alcohol dehydrogenase [Anaerolineae bacterium]
MRFEFATAARILFGVGVAKEVGAIAATLGRRALVVTGRSGERAVPVLEGLRSVGVTAETFAAVGEPTTDMIRDGVEQARVAACDLVIGIGGGSVIDTGKAIAALLTNGGAPLDYLEVIGRGQPLKQPAAPYIAIPTTAGTGAEVTANAVLASPEHRVKASLRSPLMLPRVAVVDPQLTYSMPPALTASTGLDALTQVLEPYVSRQANPMTDTFCREGLMRAAHSLYQAYENGADAEAREDMALVSLFGGLALANAKLGAVHGLAGVLGGMFDAPHGALCGRLLPYVMEANVKALRAREPEHPALERYDDVAVILTGEWEAEAEDGVAWVQELCTALKVPGLATYGVTAAAFPTIIEKAQAASSMKGNPIQLTAAELRGILNRAL